MKHCCHLTSGRMVNTPASYSGGPGFFFWFSSVPPGEWWYSTLKPGDGRFLPYRFQIIIIHLSPDHLLFIVKLLKKRRKTTKQPTILLPSIALINKISSPWICLQRSELTELIRQCWTRGSVPFPDLWSHSPSPIDWRATMSNTRAVYWNFMQFIKKAISLYLLLQTGSYV
jgi:hypothetical protein